MCLVNWPTSQPKVNQKLPQLSKISIVNGWLSGWWLISQQFTLWPRYFDFFKCKEFPRYMQGLEISELNISEKNLIWSKWMVLITLNGQNRCFQLLWLVIIDVFNQLWTGKVPYLLYINLHGGHRFPQFVTCLWIWSEYGQGHERGYIHLELMTLPSTETLANTTCHTFGIKFHLPSQN